jgi:hypothetical protein
MEHAMLETDPRYPGYEQGWAVIKGTPDHWQVAGIYGTQAEAQAACTAEGAGYQVRWGSYNPQSKDFITGDPD